MPLRRRRGALTAPIIEPPREHQRECDDREQVKGQRTGRFQARLAASRAASSMRWYLSPLRIIRPGLRLCSHECCRL